MVLEVLKTLLELYSLCNILNIHRCFWEQNQFWEISLLIFPFDIFCVLDLKKSWKCCLFPWKQDALERNYFFPGSRDGLYENFVQSPDQDPNPPPPSRTQEEPWKPLELQVFSKPAWYHHLLLTQSLLNHTSYVLSHKRYIMPHMVILCWELCQLRFIFYFLGNSKISVYNTK